MKLNKRKKWINAIWALIILTTTIIIVLYFVNYVYETKLAEQEKLSIVKYLN